MAQVHDSQSAGLEILTFTHGFVRLFFLLMEALHLCPVQYTREFQKDGKYPFAGWVWRLFTDTSNYTCIHPALTSSCYISHWPHSLSETGTYDEFS